MNILIVEDDRASAKTLYQLLQSNKYECDVAYGYFEAKELLDKNTYALILLDWNLGDGDGKELLAELRHLEIKTPVLMLSANSDIEGKVEVLDTGADDYLSKPYSHIELLARIRALLRRDTSEKKSLISIANVTLDTRTREVYVDGELLNLTTAEFDLLELLMKNKNVVLTRFQISEHLNKDNYSVRHSNIVDVHIKNLRKKIGSKEFIKSVRGLGYTIKK